MRDTLMTEKMTVS